MMSDSYGAPQADGLLPSVEPVPVSPLRAAIPSAVASSLKVIDLRDVIQSAPARFAEQYSHYPQGKSYWNPKRTMGEIIRDLQRLDTDTCSASDVNEIVGNNSWASLECEVCGESVQRVVRIGEEPDYEARWVDVCAGCLGYAASAIETRSAKTEGFGPQDESAAPQADAQPQEPTP